MEKLIFTTGSGKSEILVGADWRIVNGMIDMSGAVIITDSNVRSIYGKDFPELPVITIEAGEKSKSIASVEQVLLELLRMGVDRSSFILGIGGGVVSDIAGFAASVFMRGVKFGFVSTTLLSQVDASIGGKNGVNLSGVKNMVGTFSQPEFVICDPTMLATLPQEEYISGLGEVVKHALIRDEKMVGFIEENLDAVLNRDLDILQRLIYRSIEIKTAIAASDERETGERRLLNFGHTIGHAIEAITGLPHGMAISHGMAIASEISFDEGMIDISELGRIRSLLERLGLVPEISIEKGSIAGFLKSDKKREDNNIHFILLARPGEAVSRSVTVESILARLSEKGF